MNLPNPVPGVDPGPDYANNLQSSLNVIDQHNHSVGQGVQINPSGINLNAPLPFNNNAATSVQAVVFSQQASYAPLNAIFVGTDGNLYFNDGASDPSIQITAGGVVNATSSGISSGSATASFVGSVLVVNAASNTPANIQAGSILLGNNVASSKFLTLSPPGAMPANYQITLPVLPAQTNVLVMSSSGVMASQTYDQIGQGMTSVGANAIQVSTTRSTGSTVGTGGVAMSSSSGAFSVTSTSPVAVTNLSTTITTSGRPVQIMLVPDGTSNGSNVGISAINNTNFDTGYFYIYRNGSEIARINPRMDISNAADSFAIGLYVPAGSVNHIDPVAAGTYTYAIYASSDQTAASAFIYVNYAILVTYEL